MRVTLFRDLPTEGWFSMERYADELGGALRALGCDARDYVLPRPAPEVAGRAGAWLNLAWRLLVYPLAARRHQGDVNHVLDHSYAHLLNTLEPARTVVTCHDIAPLVFDRAGVGLSHWLWRNAYHAMKRVAQVVTISNFTAQEMRSHGWGGAPPITPIWYGVSANFGQRREATQTRDLRDSHLNGCRTMILHVGSCAPRKNLEVLLKALPLLANISVGLAQIGGRWSAAQQALVHAATAPVVQPGPAAGPTLAAWYQAADVFVFPSVYEGFGLPVLEAMAAGLPVVCARAASLPEVAGEAAVYFDPHNPADLAEKVRAVLGDPGLRGRLIEAGRTRAQSFTWERTARETLSVYERIC
jgi:glycosyltransferase involved in cell wall biosynthesis